MYLQCPGLLSKSTKILLKPLLLPTQQKTMVLYGHQILRYICGWWGWWRHGSFNTSTMLNNFLIHLSLSFFLCFCFVFWVSCLFAITLSFFLSLLQHQLWWLWLTIMLTSNLPTKQSSAESTAIILYDSQHHNHQHHPNHMVLPETAPVPFAELYSSCFFFTERHVATHMHFFLHGFGKNHFFLYFCFRCFGRMFFWQKHLLFYPRVSTHMHFFCERIFFKRCACHKYFGQA